MQEDLNSTSGFVNLSLNDAAQHKNSVVHNSGLMQQNNNSKSEDLFVLRLPIDTHLAEYRHGG